MSLLIKGMEMPTERESFNLTIKYNGTVLDAETGMQVAEAYELPPHGRVGDLDELKAKIKKEDNAYGFDSYGDGMYDAFQSVYQCIDAAPTIIPEDKEVSS